MQAREFLPPKPPRPPKTQRWTFGPTDVVSIYGVDCTCIGNTKAGYVFARVDDPKITLPMTVAEFNEIKDLQSFRYERDGVSAATSRSKLTSAVRSLTELSKEKRDFVKWKGRACRKFLRMEHMDITSRWGPRLVEALKVNVGRYAWACIGFVPDRASWNYHIRLEGLGRLTRSRNELKPEVYHAYQDVLSNSNPLLIRNVIQWKQLVKSTELYGPDGEPLPIAIGKAILLETGARWYGEFDLEDAETMRVFNEYVGRK
jgi:hypothetical protein